MTQFITQGRSMLPSILPGARLEVTPACGNTILPGDVVCYPSDHNVSYLLKRRRGKRPADDWKTQHVPDPNDAPRPKTEL